MQYRDTGKSAYRCKCVALGAYIGVIIRDIRFELAVHFPPSFCLTVLGHLVSQSRKG